MDNLFCSLPDRLRAALVAELSSNIVGFLKNGGHDYQDLTASMKFTFEDRSYQAFMGSKDMVVVVYSDGVDFLNDDDRHVVTVSTGKELFRFESHGEWVNKAREYFQAASTSEKFVIAIDAAGNVLRLGSDFAHARDNDLFPVTVYEYRPSA